jgi:hypothetical protein
MNIGIDNSFNSESSINDFDLNKPSLNENIFFDNNNSFSASFISDPNFLLPVNILENQTSYQTEVKVPTFLNNLNKILDKTIVFAKIIKKVEKEGDDVPMQYTFEMINPIIQQLNIPSHVKKKIFMDSNLNKIETHMNDIALSGKKRRRRRRKEKIILDDDKVFQKVGRKKQDDFTKRKHDKNSADNIIKKLKLKFFEYSLKFLNNILNAYLDKTKIIEYTRFLRKDIKIEDETQNLIKFLDYKFVDKIKKETDLQLLKSPLKDIFSNDISPKYSTLSRDSNKKMIERILEDQKDNLNIMFAFNLTFEEWIEIFTFKKELKSFIILDKDKMKDLNDKFIKLDKLILEIYDKNYTNNYLSYFISYAFNYKRWFIMKRGRNRVSNKMP